MPSKSRKSATEPAAHKTSGMKETSFVFPNISKKHSLEMKTVLEDQILVVDNFLSTAECKSYVKLIESLPLELTPPKRRGEAVRVNYRFSIPSTEFAGKLQAVFDKHVPPFRPGSAIEPHSFNSNIRLYKYTPSQHFGPHYDDSVVDTTTGAKSEWTLLVYLSGIDDGVEGGETIFYKSEKRKPEDAIHVPLTRGTALFHRHGQDCMFHEGSKVIKGTKYVLRSDVMFKL